MTRITSCCRPTRRTSGSVYLFIRSSESEVKRWKAMPGRTRPARPRRCFAAAADTATSSRELISLSASYLSSLTRPVSMTQTTSSMVIEVSATLVDRTTFITPLGGRSNTFRWSSGGRDPCKGRIQLGSSTKLPPAVRPATFTRVSRRSSISFVPGRKTRMAAVSMSPLASALSAMPASHLSSLEPGRFWSALSTSPPA